MITEQQIRDIEPGRELDALIEQHIFGKTVEWSQDEITDPYPIVPAEYSYIVDHYSTDISAAWDVTPKIPCMQLQRKQDGEYVVRWGSYSEKENVVTADIAPEAICKAALIAHLRGEDNP